RWAFPSFGGHLRLLCVSHLGFSCSARLDPRAKASVCPTLCGAGGWRHLRPAGAAASEILASGGDCEQVGRAEQLVKDRQIHARIRLGRDHGKPATGRGATRGGERSGGSSQTNRGAGAGEAQRRSAEPQRWTKRGGREGAVGPDESGADQER